MRSFVRIKQNWRPSNNIGAFFDSISVLVLPPKYRKEVQSSRFVRLRLRSAARSGERDRVPTKNTVPTSAMLGIFAEGFLSLVLPEC